MCDSEGQGIDFCTFEEETIKMQFRVNGGDVKTVSVKPMPTDEPKITDTLVIINSTINDMNEQGLVFNYKIIESDVEGGGEEVLFTFEGIDKIEFCEWSLGFNETLGLTTLTETTFTDGLCHDTSDNKDSLVPLTLFSKKPRYRFQLKKPSLKANVNLTGEVTASASILGRVDIEALLRAETVATVELTTVSDEWQTLGDFSSQVSSGNISDVLLASVAFDGNVFAAIQVQAPFNSLVPDGINATGEVAAGVENLFAATPIERPKFNLTVNLPKFGNILSNLSIPDILEMLKKGLEFLIGQEDTAQLTPNPANQRSRRRRSLREEDERVGSCDSGYVKSSAVCV